MSLTGLQIFKYLPAAKKAENSNCKKCGCPTCMAYALKLAKQQIGIDKCPFVPEALIFEFGEASKIQQHQIQLSDNLVTGGENVMYRHDKTFVNRTVFAIELDSNDVDFDEKLQRIASYKIERIGELLSVDAIYLRGEGSSYDLAFDKVLKSGLAVLPNPKIFKLASGSTFDELKSASMDLIKKEEKNIVLETFCKKGLLDKTLELLTVVRRAAINKRYEPMTYPVLVHLDSNMNINEACVAGSALICRYANILVLKDFDEALISTLLTLRQNIYTNPQKPLQVEAKVYEFNEPNENSPILLTTNFALTYFAVAGELDSLPFGSYLVVIPSDGMSVLTAWSADKFTAELVAKTVEQYNLLNKVKTRKIIIPGLLSHMQEELQEAMSEWEIVVGTIEACQIPEFLCKN